MSIGIAILLIVLAIVAGSVGGYFIARNYMMDYFKKNPPVNEDMLRMLMMQMGQKPSEKKIKQMMASMQVGQKKRIRKNKL